MCRDDASKGMKNARADDPLQALLTECSSKQALQRLGSLATEGRSSRWIQRSNMRSTAHAPRFSVLLHLMAIAQVSYALRRKRREVTSAIL